LRDLTGNLAGLKPSERNALERIYRRRVGQDEIVSSDLGVLLCELSRSLARQIGVLISRRGEIEFVIVGDASRIFLPEVGRLRAGHGRFRGLRLVHTHLRNEPLSRDDLVDLALLRLDWIAAIGTHPDGRPGDLHQAHLVPHHEGKSPWVLLPPVPFHRATHDFLAQMAALEEEFDRISPSTRATSERSQALLVIAEIGKRRGDLESRMHELKELTKSAGLRVVDVVVQRRSEADPRFLIGRGKLEDVLVRAMQHDADLLVFDPDLTPGQAHTIASFTDIRVVDRTMVILDIFAQRARSRDAKLQVELAQLRYRLPRLQEENTMMSRLVGGIGGRGPGETKLEISRRRARERVHRLEKEIDATRKQRAGRRSAREKKGLPVVAIVGYTNAGKSTLLNSLTGSEVVAEDKLFATLDPTTRRLRFPREREVILADTVGFIRDLPKDLAQAFRATLEELNQADLLLHVVDAADPNRESQISAVETILRDLELAETPRLLVYNKIDRMTPDERDVVAGIKGTVSISALDSKSCLPLLAAVENALWREGYVMQPKDHQGRENDENSDLATDPLSTDLSSS
jgi:GTP-binding protein HflX